MKNDPTPAARFVEGQKLAGCYSLKRRLENCGESGIWLAYDEVLGKDVSLHFVPSMICSSPEAMSALRQEVRRARQLIHPNILRVYDLVEAGDWAAISMDAFAGESLASRLAKSKSGCLDAEGIQPWIPQLCQTLDDAHKINVLHGDLSPRNLLLCDSAENVLLGSAAKLFVINFGISRCLADTEAKISGKPHARMGARSPQEITGQKGTRLDDVYGLGALLFECLTGRLPFSGENLSAQIPNTPPQSVSHVRGKNARKVPQSWEKTIASCLEKKPEARPQSVAEIAGRLGSLGSKETPAAEAPVAAAAPAKSAAKTTETTSPVETKTANESSDAAARSNAPASSDQRKSTPEVSSGQAGERSRFPGLGLALAAGLMVIGAAGYYFNGFESGRGNPDSPAPLASTEPSEESEILPASNVTIAAQTPPQPPERKNPEPAPESSPDLEPAPDQPATLLAAATTPVAAAKPEPAPVVAAGASAALSEEEKEVAAKASALETARKAVLAAEKTSQEMAAKKREAEAGIAEVQKALEKKAKALDPVKKAAEEAIAGRKKLQDEQKAADLAAEQARQLAAEKTRLAEAAKKAIAELEARNKEKLAAQEKAESEIQAMQKALAEKQQSGTGMAKAAAEAEAAHQRNLAAVKQSEQELEQARLVAAEARRLREEAEAERRKLGQELAEMQKMMEKKKAEIETRLKKLANAGDQTPVVVPKPEPAPAPDVKPPAPTPSGKPATPVTPAAATPVPQTPAPVAVLPKPATPAPATPALVAVLPKPATPAPATPAPVAVLPKPATPAPATPVPVIATPKLSPQTPPPQLALKTDPEKPPTLPATPAPKVGGPEAGGENSLGMKFLPVGDVEFCVWQTRVKDFEAFAKAVNLKSSAWKGPGFKQTPDHPVVNVTWIEAVAFCKWLTERERKEGALPANQFYRLPTDLEWSKAVGLGEETGKTPEARDMGISDVYPWGNQWPPPPRSGNYTGEETGSDVAIKGYDDSYPWTSPVGSFPPNRFGLYDMGGNVWQWCMDAWNSDSRAKVLRGASWYNGALKLSLLSSCRVHASPDSSTDNYGFRIVRAADGGKAGRN